LCIKFSKNDSCPKGVEHRIYYLIHHIINMFIYNNSRIKANDVPTDNLELFWEFLIKNSINHSDDTYYSISNYEVSKYSFLALNNTDCLSYLNSYLKGYDKVLKQTGLLQVLLRAYIIYNFKNDSLYNDSDVHIGIDTTNPELIVPIIYKKVMVNNIQEFYIYARLNDDEISCCYLSNINNLKDRDIIIDVKIEDAAILYTSNIVDEYMSSVNSTINTINKLIDEIGAIKIVDEIELNRIYENDISDYTSDWYTL